MVFTVPPIYWRSECFSCTRTIWDGNDCSSYYFTKSCFKGCKKIQMCLVNPSVVLNIPILSMLCCSAPDQRKIFSFFVGFLVQWWCQPSSGFSSKPTLINNLWIIPLCHFTQFKGCAFASQFVHSGIKTRSAFLHQYFSHKWNLGRSVLTSADKED